MKGACSLHRAYDCSRCSRKRRNNNNHYVKVAVAHRPPACDPLRPYIGAKQKPECPNLLANYIRVVVKGIWIYMLLGLAFHTLGVLLWYFGIFQPSAAPVPEFWIGQIVFIVGFLIFAFFSYGDTRFRNGVSAYEDLLNSVTSLSEDYTGAFIDAKLRILNTDRTVINALYIAFHFTRTMAYATKWEFRKKIDIDLLPLPADLKDELKRHPDDPVSHMVRHVITSSSLLYNKRVIPPAMTGRVSANLGSFNNSKGAITKSRIFDEPSVYRYHRLFMVGLYVIGMFMLHLYPFYGFWSYVYVIYFIWAVFGLLAVSEYLQNPFMDTDLEEFVDYAIGEQTDDAAKTIDGNWRTKLEEVGLGIVWEKNGMPEGKFGLILAPDLELEKKKEAALTLVGCRSSKGCPVFESLIGKGVMPENDPDSCHFASTSSQDSGIIGFSKHPVESSVSRFNWQEGDPMLQ